MTKAKVVIYDGRPPCDYCGEPATTRKMINAQESVFVCNIHRKKETGRTVEIIEESK